MKTVTAFYNVLKTREELLENMHQEFVSTGFAQKKLKR
jgi:hypothetical protein